MPSLLLALAFALRPALSEDRIVDDEDGAPGFSTTSDNWATWGMSGAGYDGGDLSYHYLSHTVGDGSRQGTATWQPYLPTAGTWRIATWFRRTENRTDDADHVITDGLGAQGRRSIDQQGDGASGWVDLGEYWCDAGFGGCIVTLDGDDGASDEANAVRFTLVVADGEPPDRDPCDEAFAPGFHSLDFYAGDADGSDWEDAAQATGAQDGREAHSPNVDEGEALRAWGFDLCDPAGEERIERVVLAVRARTQYESGTYALQLALDAGGTASTSFTGTGAAWHELDLTGQQAWDWGALAALVARLSLYDHPGGARDSDAWVDAFRLRVDFTTEADDPPPEDSAPPAEDPPEDSAPPTTDSPPGDSGQVEEPGGPPGEHRRWVEDEVGCAVAAAPARLLLLAGLILAARRGRRRPRGS